MSEALQRHLGEFYKLHVLHGKLISEAARPFKRAVAEDAELKAKALARRSELENLNRACNGKLHMRCYVSHVQLTGLNEALQ